MQESGPTDIFLWCIAAIWGQSTVFSHPELSRALLSVGSSCRLVTTTWHSFPSWVPSGLTSSYWRATIANDSDILYSLIWLEIFYFSCMREGSGLTNYDLHACAIEQTWVLGGSPWKQFGSGHKLPLCLGLSAIPKGNTGSHLAFRHLLKF